MHREACIWNFPRHIIRCSEKARNVGCINVCVELGACKI
jgi:hypothetical protein